MECNFIHNPCHQVTQSTELLHLEYFRIAECRLPMDHLVAPRVAPPPVSTAMFCLIDFHVQPICLPASPICVLFSNCTNHCSIPSNPHTSQNPDLSRTKLINRTNRNFASGQVLSQNLPLCLGGNLSGPIANLKSEKTGVCRCSRVGTIRNDPAIIGFTQGRHRQKKKKYPLAHYCYILSTTSVSQLVKFSALHSASLFLASKMLTQFLWWLMGGGSCHLLVTDGACEGIGGCCSCSGSGSVKLANLS